MNEEVKEVENTSIVVANVNELKSRKASDVKIFTTLDLNDQKKLFNIENNECDFKINDCIGQSIRMVDVYIKNIVTPLANPEVDEETGEVIKSAEVKKICILFDDQGKSYVTASKTFTFSMMNYIGYFGIENIKKGVELKFTNKKVKGSSNKALSFELI